MNKPLFEEGFSRNLTRKKTLVVTVAATALAMLLITWAWMTYTGGDEAKKPLYWVSQMDPDYRSSAPGKCPHGMDLIPVYAEDLAAFNAGPGVVQIAPEVQNQLGVRKVIVESGSLKQVLRTYGRVMPDPDRIIKLSPRVTGWVDILFVTTVGEPVKRGQPLYALYSPQLVDAQERFLEVSKGRDPTQTLKAEGELRALKMDDIAIAQLKNDGAAQQRVIFYAPSDGMVDMLKISEGSYVEPGDMLMAIGAMENVLIELDVFESQASLIQPRQALTFTTPAYPGLVWQGEIDYVYPGLDKKMRTLRFRARVDNAKMLLLPHMQVQAFIALPERKPAILVPRQAIIHIGQQDRAVLDMGEGRFKSVAVTLGESNSEKVEVLDGLQEGDVVVASAHFLIDSESSKTSDFKRMEARDEAASQYPPTWVNAVIKEIDLEERKFRLQHEAIQDWKMPGMTMDFKVVDELNMQSFKVDDRVRVRIADGEPLFQVLDIQPLESGKNP